MCLRNKNSYYSSDTIGLKEILTRISRVSATQKKLCRTVFSSAFESVGSLGGCLCVFGADVVTHVQGLLSKLQSTRPKTPQMSLRFWTNGQKPHGCLCVFDAYLTVEQN